MSDIKTMEPWEAERGFVDAVGSDGEHTTRDCGHMDVMIDEENYCEVHGPDHARLSGVIASLPTFVNALTAIRNYCENDEYVTALVGKVIADSGINDEPVKMEDY